MTLKRWTVIALFFLTGLARAGAPPACASLCGEWRLDATASDSPQQLLDAAFKQYKEPKARHSSRTYGDNIESLSRAADEEALGPILTRPRSKELREELQRALQQPRALKISGIAEDIRLAGDGNSQQSLTPGERHTRVDSYGTARIEARWRGVQLAVSERYDRRNQQETAYALGTDGSLRVTQVLQRSGLPRVTIRSIYRRL
jgi:hypothetical protein